MYEKYKGLGQYSKAYEVMLKNDVHKEGTVDRILQQQMIKLCDDTLEFLYGSYTKQTVTYQKGQRLFLEDIVSSLCENKKNEEKINKILHFVHRLGDKLDNEALLFRGSEEEIIRRGSTWCTDVARVLAILFQIAGLPSRIVQAFNLNEAYSGHVLYEIFFNNTWQLVDAINNYRYYLINYKAANALDIMENKQIIINKSVFIDYPQFLGVGIVNYNIANHQKYDYTKSTVNDYYQAILN